MACAAFLALAEPILQAVPETDNGWMLAVFPFYAEGKGPAEMPLFLLRPWPHFFEPPVLKALLWGIDCFLQLPFRAFLLIGVGIHVLNAVLLGFLCRGMGLPRSASLAAGVIFATGFIHFHAYLWLPVAQHPYALSTLLALLILFLLTERRLRQGRPAGALYALTGTAAVACSLQHSGFIALLCMVGAPWVVRGWTAPERQRFYARWLPVWILFLIYPLMAMSFFRNDTAISLAKWPWPPWLKAAGLLWAGAGFLFLGGWGLRFRRLLVRRAWFLGVGIWGLWALWDSRQLLLPVHAFVPWMTVLHSFLDPFQTALQMDPTDSYYYVPAQVSVFLFLAVGFGLGAFGIGFVRRKRWLALLGIWYAAVLAYLLLHRHVASSMPFRTQSRYFLYVTPIFSVVLGAVATFCLTLFSRKAGWGRGKRDALLAGVGLALCVPNLLAIRVALLRGRLTNTYLMYDDLRTARLIREDWARTGLAADPGGLQVENAVPTLFSRMPWDPPVDYGRIQHDNLRRMLGEEFHDRRMRAIRINGEPPGRPAVKAYRIEADRILDETGRSIEPFGLLLEEALSKWKGGEREAARGLFMEAIRERPFLLKFLLSRDLRLADLMWITGGKDFMDFFELIDSRHLRWGVGPLEKTRRTSDLIRRELSHVALCLFFLSYLEHEAQRLEASRFWFSQIGFFEREPEALVAWLAQIPPIHASASLRAFLEKARDPLFFREPLVWKKEDYAFGRFLIRLLLHRDIRSSWDNRLEIVP